MKTNLLTLWARLRLSYWFLPAVMVGAAIGLSFATLALDGAAGSPAARLGWFSGGGPEGVRLLLSTVAGSMISVTGITFSITIVALSLASTQFGPRLLNNFMRDTGNQVVLGSFIATFVFCLLVLRTVRSVEGDVFVPHVSTTLALLLTLVSLGVLIYFIHHVATSIQADNIIAGVGRDLDDAIARLFPGPLRYPALERGLRQPTDIPEGFAKAAQPILAEDSGYLQAVDYEGLLGIAVEQGSLFRLEYRPGEFIPRGNALASVWPEAPADEAVVDQVRETFILGAQRLEIQDIEYAINQLVEIAVRALSPAINDPFTAMACVDRLGAALAQLVERRPPPAYSYDAEGKLRLILQPVTFAGIADAAFNQIRQHGRSSAAVSIRLLETIAVVATHARSQADREALLRHATMIKRSSDEALPEAQDRRDVDERFGAVLAALGRNEAA